IALFSLVGIPQLSGFWPNIMLLGEPLKAEQYVLFVAIILASFVPLFVIARMWSEVFWKESHEPLTEEIDNFLGLPFAQKVVIVAPIAFLSLFSLYIGLNAEGVFEVAQKTAYELMHPNLYIKAVLNTD